MISKMRILGIAPYEGLNKLMLHTAKDFPDIELTTVTANLEEANNVITDRIGSSYDAIISRGATAGMLQKHTSVPVIAIEMTSYDILRAIRLCNPMSGKVALIGYKELTDTAEMLCSLMQYPIPIYEVNSFEDTQKFLYEIKSKLYTYVLCDAAQEQPAKEMGLTPVLVTSAGKVLSLLLSRHYCSCRNHPRQTKNQKCFHSTYIC